jgi:chromosome segregation ATPase
MDEQAFQMKLAELMNKIKELPERERPTLERLAEEARKRRERIQSSVAELQESLDYLRLTVKYLVFDLEATRRENAYLRKLVEQANREDAPQDESDPDEYSEGDGSGAE